MIKDEQRILMVHYWWTKAEESLSSAKRELKAESLEFAVNRLYYSVFYAASAALLARKLTFKKHSGVRAAFHQEFIKKGLLDLKWGKFYDQLFEDRQEGDYMALISFEQKYVEFQLSQCSRFLKELRNLIPSISENKK
ncbi:HEPN domain-containing protein [candidate division WOR-3 bacterium]|nr:HEPN domain-containing protein [candidate division WOR-3 bacterium]